MIDGFDTWRSVDTPPGCPGVMAAELRFGVTTDACRPHGMWVNVGETEGLVRDVRWSGAYP